MTGMLLAGGGNVDHRRQKNFLVVDKKTSTQQIEEAFKDFTTREDVAIVLIAQYIADEIRYTLEKYVASMQKRRDARTAPLLLALRSCTDRGSHSHARCHTQVRQDCASHSGDPQQGAPVRPFQGFRACQSAASVLRLGRRLWVSAIF